MAHWEVGLDGIYVVSWTLCGQLHVMGLAECYVVSWTLWGQLDVMWLAGRYGVTLPDGESNCSRLQNVQTCSGAHRHPPSQKKNRVSLRRGITPYFDFIKQKYINASRIEDCRIFERETWRRIK